MPAQSEPVEPADALRAFVRAARHRAALRALSRTLLDLGIIAGGFAVAAISLTALTDRGDLWAPLLEGAVLGSAVVLTVLAIRAARRHFGSDMSAAVSIAAYDAPLSSHPASVEVAQAQRLLRHEILGALELTEVVEDEAADSSPRLRSPKLAQQYVGEVAARAAGPAIDPGLALPQPNWWRRGAALTAIAAALAVCTLVAPLARGMALLLEGADGRPPTPPEPVWSSLSLDLVYPEHTLRPRRSVPNPSGALRVPAGTQVGLELVGRRPARAGRVLVAYDATELTAAPSPDVVELEPGDAEGLVWSGSFTARSGGSWTIVLLDDEEDELEESSRRSSALPLMLEVDRPPEVELLPLPRHNREVSESDRVDIRFHARDDFGVVSGELVYQLPDGATHRLAADTLPRPTRTWRHRYTWDISQIPIAERSEVLYWVEVRDNDPGLALDPLPDPPGKVTRSATMRLIVRDDEAEHAANIVRLSEIRDAAVDLLAARMMTLAFARLPIAPTPTVATPPVEVRASQARDILARGGNLLAMLAASIDALSMDALADERDVAALTAIHKRLMKLHRVELKLHEAAPPGLEFKDPPATAVALRKMAGHNGEEVTQLEDEIIRLDDLVDGEIIKRLEALVARLEATQQKLLDLLEQLKAGDESVRAQIDQLEQRRREDLRRIAEARAMLRKEVDEEFMNLDAFKTLEEMARQEGLSEMLRRGELDEALEQARQQLGQMRMLRDQVQQRLGQAGPGQPLSEEDRKRARLLRELSRLQDDEGGLRSQTRKIHERWRERVADEKADDATRSKAKREAAQLKKQLDKINDARLGRDGRRGLEDAKAALEKLEGLAEQKGPSRLDMAEAAEKAAKSLGQAAGGTEDREKEGKAVGKAKARVEGLARDLAGPLPKPGDVLSAEDREQIGELQRRQHGVRKRAEELMKSSEADLLPQTGRRAMRRADRAMGRSGRELGAEQPAPAVDGQSRAWNAIKEAIDSLRRGSPPPPTGGTSGEASTEAERDRSLRDELMEAMQEGAPDGYAEPVKRYYEELLR